MHYIYITFYINLFLWIRKLFFLNIYISIVMQHCSYIRLNAAITSNESLSFWFEKIIGKNVPFDNTV